MNLKPCPFCGETPERLNDGSNEVVCHTCDLWGMKVSEWNRRQDNTKAETLAEVEKMIEGRINKHVADERYLIRRGHAREQYMKYKRYKSECESILSAIQKLKEGGRG